MLHGRRVKIFEKIQLTRLQLVPSVSPRVRIGFRTLFLYDGTRARACCACCGVWPCCFVSITPSVRGKQPACNCGRCCEWPCIDPSRTVRCPGRCRSQQPAVREAACPVACERHDRDTAPGTRRRLGMAVCAGRHTAVHSRDSWPGPLGQELSTQQHRGRRPCFRLRGWTRGSGTVGRAACGGVSSCHVVLTVDPLAGLHTWRMVLGPAQVCGPGWPTSCSGTHGH